MKGDPGSDHAPYLIVANQTIGGEQLTAKLDDLAGVLVLVQGMSGREPYRRLPQRVDVASVDGDRAPPARGGPRLHPAGSRPVRRGQSSP